MKTLLCLLAALPFVMGATSAPVYQVVNQHPEDLERLLPHVETVRQDGRLWLVRPRGAIPAAAMENLRLVDKERVDSWMVPAKRMAKSSPDAEVQSLLASVDADRFHQDVVWLSSIATRRVGTQDNRSATTLLEERLRAMGYTVERVCHRAQECSVVGEKSGSEPSRGVILVMAHFDSVGAPNAGADDNASGAAALLEMAHLLSSTPLRHTLRLFFTNGEENGLLGSNHYARQLAQNGSISSIKLAVNMDMVGYNSNGVVELETNSANARLADEFADLVTTYTSLRPKITLGAWGSDHVPFLERGVPTILTIEDWSTKTPCYHLACDLPATLNNGYAAQIIKLNLAAVVLKDRQ